MEGSDAHFVNQGHLAMSGHIFGCHNTEAEIWGLEELLSSSGQKPGMPPNIVQCTGKTPT